MGGFLNEQGQGGPGGKAHTAPPQRSESACNGARVNRALRIPGPTGASAMDDAPDVSDEYSFLLESSVLDRDGSSASPQLGDAFAHFAVSKLSQVGGREC